MKGGENIANGAGSVAVGQRQKIYDIFITHAWRYHEDWTQVCGLLNRSKTFKWRNFSLPWHDPAMDTNSDVGRAFIYDSLETQIIPVHGVILLSGVYTVKSAQRWLDLEIEFARKHNKPVVAMPAIGDREVPERVALLCDRSATWDLGALVTELQEVRGLPNVFQES